MNLGEDSQKGKSIGKKKKKKKREAKSSLGLGIVMKKIEKVVW
jgi:hypothetical protein